MDKSPITKKPEITEEEKYKSKRKKHETVCNDKRRSYFSCGVCGSEDVIEQGVGSCERCGNEVEFIDTERWFPKWPKICDCKLTFRETMSLKNYKKVRKCITCGAVETNNCPACKGNCWNSIYGEKYCKKCGFRFEGYKK